MVTMSGTPSCPGCGYPFAAPAAPPAASAPRHKSFALRVVAVVFATALVSGLAVTALVLLLRNQRPDCSPGMIAIPGGSFMMGSENGFEHERPVHRVKVKGFCMDSTEVTVSSYQRCVQGGACTPPDTKTGLLAELPETAGNCNSDKSGRDNHPINCVDWNQADRFCRWAGKRLPTEEEWEYAARGGSKQLEYPWGQQPPAKDLACFDRSGANRGTCPVGSYPAEAFGLRDMAANVSEWTSSRYTLYERKVKDVPYVAAGEALGYRMNRGGNWLGSRTHMRGAMREFGGPEYHSADLGFRCVSDGPVRGAMTQRTAASNTTAAPRPTTSPTNEDAVPSESSEPSEKRAPQPEKTARPPRATPKPPPPRVDPPPADTPCGSFDNPCQ